MSALRPILALALALPAHALAAADELRLVSVATGLAEPLPVEDLHGAGGGAACFRMPTSIATLTETFVIHDTPRPARTVRGCFDGAAIAAGLARGEAVAFVAERGAAPGTDRVVAVFGDGRGYVWTQFTACGAPLRCPPAAPETQ